jgi:hypothetical protein
MGTPMKACICKHAKAFHPAKSGATGLVWACNCGKCGCQNYRRKKVNCPRVRANVDQTASGALTCVTPQEVSIIRSIR